MSPAPVSPLPADALRRFGLIADRVQFVRESFNSLYKVVAGSRDYVLRIGPALRIHELDAASGEARWTDRLSSAGLTVPRFLRTPEGQASVSVRDDRGRERICSLATWIDGEALPRPMSVDDAGELGDLMARLHAASEPVKERPPGALDGRRVLLFRLPDMLSRPDHAEVFAAAHGRAQAAVRRLWERPDRPRLVHGDLTANNVVRTNDGLVPIDFQDMFWGHREQDVAFTLFSFRRDDYASLAAAFRRGYEQRLPWPDMTVTALDDLFVARRLLMANLALALDRPGLDDYLAAHAAALRSEGDTPQNASIGLLDR